MPRSLLSCRNIVLEIRLSLKSDTEREKSTQNDIYMYLFTFVFIIDSIYFEQKGVLLSKFAQTQYKHLILKKEPFHLTRILIFFLLLLFGFHVCRKDCNYSKCFIHLKAKACMRICFWVIVSSIILTRCNYY